MHTEAFRGKRPSCNIKWFSLPLPPSRDSDEYFKRTERERRRKKVAKETGVQY